jgi:hypothetical protein
MKLKIMKGGEEVVNNMIKFQPILYGLYGFAVLILFFLIYILFFKNKSNEQELKPDITSNPNITISPTYSTLSPNTYITTNPNSTLTPNITTSTTSPSNIVDIISTKAGFIKTDISKDIASSETILMIKGKLEDWGDDINSLPDNLKEQAVNCYNNPNGCVF